VVLSGLLLPALPVLCGVAAGAGETVILARLVSTAGGFGVALLFCAGVEEVLPGTGGVPERGEPVGGVPDPAGPPSFASLRWRICSMVSWSGASGVDDAGAGCSVGSMFAAGSLTVILG
jgi:hypothetical protein